MRKKDCKEGLEVIFNKGLNDEDNGVIVEKDGSIFTNSGRYVWVKWKDESVLYVEPESIEPFAKPNTELKKQALAKLTTEEIEALGIKL